MLKSASKTVPIQVSKREKTKSAMRTSSESDGAMRAIAVSG